MKKLTFILFILLFACSNDDDGGECTCRGEFSLVSDTENSFFVNGVDCDTGEPTTSTQNDSGNPVFYLGCSD